MSKTPDKMVSNEMELREAVNNAAVSTVIGLDSDIQLTESFVIPANKDITLLSVNKKSFCKLIGANGESTIVVEKNSVLRLESIIVTHMNGATGWGVYVNVGGTLYMSGGEISNNAAILDMSINIRGTGISIDIGSGGGVFNRGSFCMSGGEISNNLAGSGGGVLNIRSDFSMSGGKISGNKASYDGGGVFNYNGTISLSGGSIFDNSAKIAGGGIYNYGSLFMSGGTIFNNNADDKGGGVYNYFTSSSFDLSKGEISKNTASLGGGVCSDNAFIMSGATISGNIAIADGGGVYAGNGEFTMSGGKISGNKANNDGGGAYIGAIEYDLSGGKISGNKANNIGNDMYNKLSF
jgi:hypothetical protein